MRLKINEVKRILSRFSHAKILVVGDLILDEFIWGKADRISPEAPVPVVWAQSQSFMPGGASNVANNMASLGAHVSLCGVVGDDKNGNILMDKLRESGIDCTPVVVDTLRPTTVKTRIIAAHQQMVRVDWEHIAPLSKEDIKKVTELIRQKMDGIDALVIEDYGKGMISPHLLTAIISLARKHKKIITVDPKVEHFAYYKGVTVMTPNEKEASAGSGIKITCDSDVDRAGWKLLKKLNCRAVVVTLGDKGMKVFEEKRPVFHIPTVAQEVFDVSGAGDTVISVFTLALSCGLPVREAAELSNIAAGIVVGKVGVAVVTKEEVLDGFSRFKGRLKAFK